jgi:Xaa-Pro dipeptidase
MDLKALFSEHINHVQATYEKAVATVLERGGPQIEAVLVHSGTEGIYFGDDRHIPFQPFGHFNYWLPIDRPDQMVLFQPGKKPIYFQIVPPDFWYDQTVNVEDWWADSFEIIKLEAKNQVIDHLPNVRRIAFLGENKNFARALGMPEQLHNERQLSAYLNFYRGMKTPYEVARMREANEKALVCHEAARKAFIDGATEYQIHMAYLQAGEMLEDDCGYTNIIALNEKAAVLHYAQKRRQLEGPSKVFLIDAGARHYGYNSDITRTYLHPDHEHPVFKSLLEKMETLELSLVAKVVEHTSYRAIHEAALSGVLDILLEHEIVKGERDTLVEKEITQLFFPHGVGHLIGLQVHDVGGFLKNDKGEVEPPREVNRFLRLTRPLEAGMTCTIEPGLYFIPVLLNPERNSEKGKHLNWSLIDALIPYGGIRIEDDVLVTPEGPRNLTRG